MTKNLTLRMDQAFVRKCRQVAVAQDKSLSQWVTDLILEALSTEALFLEAKKRASRRLKAGFKLGGRPLSREEAHAR